MVDITDKYIKDLVVYPPAGLIASEKEIQERDTLLTLLRLCDTIVHLKVYSVYNYHLTSEECCIEFNIKVKVITSNDVVVDNDDDDDDSDFGTSA